MNPGFDALVFLMQHSPNLERLFLELKLVWTYIILVVLCTWVFVTPVLKRTQMHFICAPISSSTHMIDDTSVYLK
jgi:hypothetical protein